MKIFKLTASTIMTLLFIVANSYALPTAGDTVTFTSTINNFSGGPFNATVTDPNDNSVTNYITFCLEKNEYISTNNTVFKVSSVVDFAALGGEGYADNSPGGNDTQSTDKKDYISDATKWVYWNYLYGSFNSELTGNKLAKAVQYSIWYLEDELEYEKLAYKNFYNDVVSAQANENGGYAIAGDVQVMNLTLNSGKEAQSQLIAAPVPEPSTMLLFGTGIAGLASIVRRRKK